jgi:hypothetical protein
VLSRAERAEIRLNELLANFPQAALGRSWRKRDAVMICPNMRAAQIYLHYPGPDTALQVINDVLSDPRVDLAVWRAGLTERGASGYSVASRSGRLTLRRGEDGQGRTAPDAFGASWSWHGDSSTLDFEVDAGRLEFHQYPNAFERIAGVLDLDQAGDIWVTAKPGCEFNVEGGDAHLGGASHGALHALDSYSPVIAAGPSPVPLPRHLRSVDLAPLCMQLLGAEMRYKVGDAR